MSWVVFALLTAISTAFANIIDKIALTKWIKRPIGSMVTFCFMQALAGGAAFFLRDGQPLAPPLVALALVGGIVYALTALFYFRAIKIEEVSRTIPLFDLTSLFVLFFATLFLGETFTLPTYIGVFLLTAGAVLISSHPRHLFRIGKGFWWMLLAILSLGTSAIIAKYLLRFADIWTVFSYSRLGTALAAIPALYFGWPVFLSAVRSHGKRVVAVMALSELLTVLASLSFTAGAAVGYVTLVNALVGTQPFFVLLFATLLSLLFPSILKEKISTVALSQKIAATILMFVGALLVTR